MPTPMQSVREFHEKFRQKIGVAFNANAVAASDAVISREHGAFMLGAAKEMAENVQSMSEALEATYVATKDPRFLRMHLILEEAAEVFAALLGGDELLLLDGLADLLYVVYGTAVTFDLPLEEAFEEIHSSNMTKDVVRSADEPRFRGKGEHFRAPNLRAILIEAAGKRGK